MRIVSGALGGRQIAAPPSRGTRPMTDKVRAALFDALGPIDGLTVLDVYAGSGALGFEALSRGASRVAAVEAGTNAIRTIRGNQHLLGLQANYSLFPTTVESWMARPDTAQQRFDLIFADPPYDQLKSDILEKLGRLLASNGTLLVSHKSKLQLEVDGLQVIQSKTYGDSALTAYRPI